ncbi:YybH family protein [Urbifossiella limnaea]|uniref:SnoaL-like domain protein n=1 Tax=Urbifossiella limnaea TaxID=2528023 RepID=A0A517XWV6_9BACT|nr:SgcJ/EcaC family oxidoreductase [Urbifossiella limnaea]QDU21986.1 SnoaL-like domain protein [Urbifossiella limnaea]
MIPTPTRRRVAITAVAALGLAAVVAGGRHEAAGQPPVTAAAAAQPAAVSAAQPAADRPADQGGVKAAVASLAASFGKGDAKAVAALFTAEGEYADDDGTTVRGRAALEKDYAEFFTKNPGATVEVEIDAVRFPSRDTAVVDAHFKVRRAKGELVVSRGSILYAREDGKWLVAILREWGGDGLSLRDLEFLIGTWETKQPGTTVTTRYEWTANKSFIRCHFSVAHDGKSVGGVQMIGRDPGTNTLRVWTFEDNGGVGDIEVTRDGKKWVFAARGTTADGHVLTATNLLTPIDADSFLWHPVQRALDGEALPDLVPVKVTRVKAKQ